MNKVSGSTTAKCYFFSLFFFSLLLFFSVSFLVFFYIKYTPYIYIYIYIVSVVHNNPYETVVCKGEGGSLTALVW